MKLNEFCPQCQQVTASRIVSHPSGTEYLCAECGTQVDFLVGDDADYYMEPTGSCEECGCNLYGDWDKWNSLCDTCQIYAWSAVNDDGWVTL